METVTIRTLASLFGKSDRQIRRDIFSGKIECDWKRGPKNSFHLVHNSKLTALLKGLSQRDAHLVARKDLIRRIQDEWKELSVARLANMELNGVIFGNSDGKLVARVQAAIRIGKLLMELRKVCRRGTEWNSCFESRKLPFEKPTAYEYIRIARDYPDGFSREKIQDFRRRVKSYHLRNDKHWPKPDRHTKAAGSLFQLIVYLKREMNLVPVADWNERRRLSWLDGLSDLIEIYRELGGKLPK